MRNSRNSRYACYILSCYLMFDQCHRCLIIQERVDIVDEPNDEKDSKADVGGPKDDAGSDISDSVISS